MTEEEGPGSVRTIDFEAEICAPVFGRQAEVVEERTDIQKFQVGMEIALLALESSEQEHAARVMEEQIILRFANEARRILHELAVGDGDSGDGCRHLMLLGSDEVGHSTISCSRRFRRARCDIHPTGPDTLTGASRSRSVGSTADPQGLMSPSAGDTVKEAPNPDAEHSRKDSSCQSIKPLEPMPRRTPLAAERM
jgi:hypothetical protein